MQAIPGQSQCRTSSLDLKLSFNKTMLLPLGLPSKNLGLFHIFMLAVILKLFLFNFSVV